jgi:FtsP/CotA-like multicopper oxidase with cupredoxin domain
MRNRSLLSSKLALSRRRFLKEATLAATGGLLVPVVSLAPAAEELFGDEPLTLKASSFRAAPDGREREVWGYNGQVPGPPIRIKHGETLRARLVNNLKVPTSIHWHGMHQPGTWRMDGVEGVSGPSVPPGADFLYEFKATPTGTHWYHSHVGVQYGNGLFGPLIVEESTPIVKYDREETLMVNDWFLRPGDELLADVVKGGMRPMRGRMEMKEGKDTGDVPFESGLVNGKGRMMTDGRSPLTVVQVRKGETIRLRLVNASSTYAFRLQIDDHPLTVIATDGAAIRPVTVDNMAINVGERYDVLLETKQDGVRWIRFVTANGDQALAVLRYAGAEGSLPPAKTVAFGPRVLQPEQLRAREQVRPAASPREIALLLGGSMMPYRWSIDGQYYPKADPIAITSGESLRFRLRNPTGMDHPFHLHGHYFRVLGKPGALNLVDPAIKDTINVPTKGEVVIQWLADNPGRWFFHCHIEWHLATGMARVLEIKPFN